MQNTRRIALITGANKREFGISSVLQYPESCDTTPH